MIRILSNRRSSIWCLAFALLLALGVAAARSSAGGERPLLLAASGTGAAAARSTTASVAHSMGLHFGDAHLRGRLDLGRKKLEHGRFVAPLDDGSVAILTLDPEIQARAETVLAQAKAPYGAIVVMSIDGRILALAGRSTTEPSLGAIELALRPWAPAASVFKLVTSAALLERGVEPDASVCYHGGLRGLDAGNLTDDPRRDGACQSFTYGLAHSQNAIIAKLAARHLDAKTLRHYAEAFGFGREPGFALPAAPSTADIPEEPLAFAKVAAGFWKTQLSPLGGAIVADTVASGGLAVTPRIVAAIVGPHGSREQPVLPQAPHRVLDKATARSLAAMMLETTRAGTARKAFYDGRGRPYLKGVEVAGKTGSLSRTEPFLDYSWFVGFAPADAPRYVVSVNLGNSPKWYLKAHTSARLVLETALAD